MIVKSLNFEEFKSLVVKTINYNKRDFFYFNMYLKTVSKKRTTYTITIIQQHEVFQTLVLS